ncbi:hypothetical protein [Nocardiopsis sp. NRRL B-16309]|uniref:hypothetical protein n=1 Tax=Nocardiopsis sp. NRRL B-16309 TaxID=1519494 RepID=UPI0006AEAD3C|nr:hypothetical protein [Nocardiopsis sp. NRRL B-16309]KOX12486.1 hypothetical protein ADL05_21680 [Nocardiopsis sp. NRRL B-16309]
MGKLTAPMTVYVKVGRGRRHKLGTATIDLPVKLDPEGLGTLGPLAGPIADGLRGAASELTGEPDWKHLALTLAWSMALKGPQAYTTDEDDYPDVPVR